MEPQPPARPPRRRPHPAQRSRRAVAIGSGAGMVVLTGLIGLGTAASSTTAAASSSKGAASTNATTATTEAATTATVATTVTTATSDTPSYAPVTSTHGS